MHYSYNSFCQPEWNTEKRQLDKTEGCARYMGTARQMPSGGFAALGICSSNAVVWGFFVLFFPQKVKKLLSCVSLSSCKRPSALFPFPFAVPTRTTESTYPFDLPFFYFVFVRHCISFINVVPEVEKLDVFRYDN